MGVWIEMELRHDIIVGTRVTPLVGVWIEIPISEPGNNCNLVTPLVGVWIEILRKENVYAKQKSLPLWECGLKFHS